MDLQEFEMRGDQCGMRYTMVGVSWTSEGSCEWGDWASIRGGGSIGCGVIC
jgi:hypothetical protein